MRRMRRMRTLGTERIMTSNIIATSYDCYEPTRWGYKNTPASPWVTLLVQKECARALSNRKVRRRAVRDENGFAAQPAKPIHPARGLTLAPHAAPAAGRMRRRRLLPEPRPRPST